jgi:hypothetical protein
MNPIKSRIAYFIHQFYGIHMTPFFWISVICAFTILVLSAITYNKPVTHNTTEIIYPSYRQINDDETHAIISYEQAPNPITIHHIGKNPFVEMMCDSVWIMVVFAGSSFITVYYRNREDGYRGYILKEQGRKHLIHYKDFIENYNK